MKAPICKLCGGKRELGQLKCKKCQVKVAKQKQREQIKKEKRKTKRLNNPRLMKLRADGLWREAVIEEYGCKCVICGSDKINIHHIVSRANRSTRWYIPNGCPLCVIHHTWGNQSAHANPLFFRQELIRMRGVEWEKKLIKKANEVWDKLYTVSS